MLGEFCRNFGKAVDNNTIIYYNQRKVLSIWESEAFGRENMKKLFKSDSDKKICGVCGGIAEYFNIDSTLVRIIWIVFTLCVCGMGFLAYLIAAAVMPKFPER